MSAPFPDHFHFPISVTSSAMSLQGASSRNTDKEAGRRWELPLEQALVVGKCTSGLLSAFFGGSPTCDLALGGDQLSLPVLQWSLCTERT